MLGDKLGGEAGVAAIEAKVGVGAEAEIVQEEGPGVVAEEDKEEEEEEGAGHRVRAAVVVVVGHGSARGKTGTRRAGGTMTANEGTIRRWRGPGQGCHLLRAWWGWGVMCFETSMYFSWDSYLVGSRYREPGNKKP